MGEKSILTIFAMAALMASAPVSAQITTPQTPPIACSGMAQQGGLILCRTEPNAKVKIARGEDDFYFENADENGVLFVGFDRESNKVRNTTIGDKGF